MKIKICGLKYPNNIRYIENLRPDFMGFIFYAQSTRMIGENTLLALDKLDQSIKKVGVFVNEPIDRLIRLAKKFSLDYVQLHGHESRDYVKKVYHEGIAIIKALQVDPSLAWNVLRNYTNYVDFFLFDTASKNYGGSGRQFDWELLKNYKEDKPFFLSGGIGVKDLDTIKEMEISHLYGVDLNSCLETSPGLKNPALVELAIKKIRDER